ILPDAIAISIKPRIALRAHGRSGIRRADECADADQQKQGWEQAQGGCRSTTHGKCTPTLKVWLSATAWHAWGAPATRHRAAQLAPGRGAPAGQPGCPIHTRNAA